jgi:hypothetical protein
MNLLRKLALVAVVFTLGSVAALAADFNGKWTADVQGRNGNTQTVTFDFHVDGAALTGKVTSPRGESDITNGKIDGDNISFDQNLNFNGNSFTIHYTGKAEGDTIHFTRQMGDRPAANFDAKRASAAAAPAPAPQL